MSTRTITVTTTYAATRPRLWLFSRPPPAALVYLLAVLALLFLPASTSGATCVAGRYGASGSDPCTDCPAGEYQPQTGKIACLPCQKGKQGTTAAALAGGQLRTTEAVSCSSCVPGTFSTQDGQATCSGGAACAQGYFGLVGQSSAAAAACGPCASGRFADETAQSSCKPGAGGECPVGKSGALGRTSSAAATCANCTSHSHLRARSPLLLLRSRRPSGDFVSCFAPHSLCLLE